nr:hypothetical protein CFP56_30208 [Quercus suber]
MQITTTYVANADYIVGQILQVEDLPSFGRQSDVYGALHEPGFRLSVATGRWLRPQVSRLKRRTWSRICSYDRWKLTLTELVVDHQGKEPKPDKLHSLSLHSHLVIRLLPRTRSRTYQFLTL